MTKRKKVGWLIFFILTAVLLLQLPRVFSQACYLVGLKFYSSRHYQAAATAFQGAVFFRPKFARGYIELGSSHLEMEENGLAEQAFLKASSIQDESCASCGLGTTYYRLGRYDEAEKAFRKAMSLNPDDICAYDQSGKMYYDLGKYQDAAAAFKREVALRPNFSVYLYLGNAHVYARQFASGVDAYSEAIRLNPVDPSAHFQLGVAYNYLERYEQAVEEYKKAIYLKPDYENAHYCLASVYVAMRNKPAALEQYEIVRKLNPERASQLFEESGLLQGRQAGKEKLYFIRIGNFSTAQLTKLLNYFKSKAGVRAISVPGVPVEVTALDTRRRQVIAEEVVALIKRRYPKLAEDPNAVVIGLIEQDMYIREKTWQFAFSYRTEGRFAIVSSARMNPVNLGEPANDDLLDHRVRKMVTKNVGLLYYLLPQNNNPKSVLYRNISGLEDLDNIGEDF
jgi:tetratricopeptide (TPR) repeat protein